MTGRSRYRFGAFVPAALAILVGLDYGMVPGGGESKDRDIGRRPPHLSLASPNNYSSAQVG